MAAQTQQNARKLGPVGRLRASLSRECGEFTKMYHALFEVCGGDIQAKSTATVWTAIIDRVSNEEARGTAIEDGGAHWVLFNNEYWLARLRMSRPTFKAALDWLESSAAIRIRKVKGEYGYPARQVALNNDLISDLIQETKGKGGNHKDLVYPLLDGAGTLLTAEEADMARSVNARKPPKPRTKNRYAGEDQEPQKTSETSVKPLTVACVETSVKPLTVACQAFDSYPEKALPSECQTSYDQVSNLLRPSVKPLTAKKKEEEERRNKEELRDVVNGNSDAEESSSNTATRSASTAALLRNFEHNSFVSEQEHPETKETREAYASEEKRISAPRLRPSEAWAVAQTKMQEFALSPDTSLPWYSIGYDKRTVGNAAQVGVAFAVRPSMIAKLQEAHPGTPFSRHNIRGADESDTQAKALAFVEAWDRICGNIEGIPDVWLPVVSELHKPKPDMGAKAIVAAIRNFPEPDDPTWTRNYHAVLASIKALDN